MPESAHETVTIDTVEGTGIEETKPEGVSEQSEPVVPEAEATTEESTETVTDIDRLKIADDVTPKGEALLAEANVARIREEVLDNDGAFTEEHYAEFKAAGYDKGVADMIMQGEIARAQIRTNEVVTAAGGQEKVQAALAWAAENLNEDQRKIVNSQLSNSDVNVATMALENLVARATPPTVGRVAAATGTSTGEYFRDEVEFQAAVSDETKMRSPAYRADVMRKLETSNKMGIIKL